jgi:hypothetical protein
VDGVDRSACAAMNHLRYVGTDKDILVVVTAKLRNGILIGVVIADCVLVDESASTCASLVDSMLKRSSPPTAQLVFPPTSRCTTIHQHVFPSYQSTRRLFPTKQLREKRSKRVTQQSGA